MLKRLTGDRSVSDTDNSAVGLSIGHRFVGAAVFAGTVFCAALSGIAAPTLLQAATNDPAASLRVQPRLCVMTAADEVCVMQLQVVWTTVVERNVCLHLPDQQQTLPCWQAQQAGEFSLTIARAENVSVQLLDEQTREVLSEVEIPVIQRDLRDTRRRRRHAWSIF